MYFVYLMYFVCSWQGGVCQPYPQPCPTNLFTRIRANPRMCVYGVFCVAAGRAENGDRLANHGINHGMRAFNIP